MTSIDFDRLRPIGLTAPIAQALAALDDNGAPMRVTQVHRETVVLHDGAGMQSAQLLPPLARALANDDEQLAVGDWVLAAPDHFGGLWVRARAEPITRLARRRDGGGRRALVSNVDTALVVMGLDGDFNPRRLERYLALIKAGEVWPVVVLTKADLCADLDDRLAALRDRVPDEVPLHAVNACAAQTMTELAPYLGQGQTLVLLGSSGAGKSTLTNTLAGNALQEVGAVRAGDGRGRHTTTARSLHLLPGGACVIDTPGLRALLPAIDEDALQASFGDIARLAAACRFGDCRHELEPGCAVRDLIPADRLRNYHKLRRELRRESMSALDRKQQVANWKVRHRAAAQRMKMKRGDPD